MARRTQPDKPLAFLLSRQELALVVPNSPANGLVRRVTPAGGKDGSFSAREVYLNSWSGLNTPELVKAGCIVLEDSGWLRQSTNKNGGRPGISYTVNPRVFEHERL